MGKPRDRREYIRIAVNLPTNRKLAGIDSAAAGWLYVCSICWAGENLTDGEVTPRIIERIAGVPARWSKTLIAAGLWHPPGHDCGSCPQPAAGQVVIHDYLQHQRSRADADKARVDGQAAADARWNAKGIPKGTTTRTREGTAVRMPEGSALPSTEAEVEVEANPYLLTLISRLAAGDARGGPPPAEVIGSWQEIAGPTVNLEAQAAAYFARFGDVAPRNERAAWLGWLRKANTLEQARHAAAQRDPDADIRPPSGCGRCEAGYLGLDDEERPIPCPRCRPHLRAVDAS